MVMLRIGRTASPVNRVESQFSSHKKLSGSIGARGSADEWGAEALPSARIEVNFYAGLFLHKLDCSRICALNYAEWGRFTIGYKIRRKSQYE